MGSSCRLFLMPRLMKKKKPNRPRLLACDRFAIFCVAKVAGNSSFFMKKDKQKVAYHKESKRNVMNDVLTEAGRRAKNRAAEKEAEGRLRRALENPTDTNGKPIAGHLLKRIAAERLVTSIGPCSAGTFDYAARIFLAELKYLWGCYTPVSRFVARTGQFILSRIEARNGAIGIVPPELDGAVVTNDFPLFAPNAGRISIAFLTWLSRTLGFVDLCVRASEGTTNRASG